MAYRHRIINLDVTAHVGENDAEKTDVIDAIRYVLHTRKAGYLLEGLSLQNWAFTHH